MYILIALAIVQLCAICASTLAIPSITTATPPSWDMQRATTFRTLLDTNLKDTHHVTATESTPPEIVVTPTPSAKLIKPRTSVRLVKYRNHITGVPGSGMQCAVM
jgi:hypothetical protein